MRAFAVLTCLVVIALAPRSGRADGAPTTHPTLTTLPEERLVGLAPLLRGADLALIESDAQGFQKQVTTMTLVAAAPSVVRDVVIHPERYGEFVRNMTESKVDRNADGTFDHHWKLSYAIDSFAGVNHYVLKGDAVEMTDPTGPSTYRWEFLPSKIGGGTVLVLYGYTDVRHSKGFLEKALKRAETLEHGFGLITQMTLLLAMKARAEQHPGEFAPYTPQTGQKMPSYQFLLDRGAVALLNKRGNRLDSITLIDRAFASPETLVRTAADVGHWKTFIPSISKSGDVGVKDGMQTYEVEQSLPLMSWTTLYWVRQAGSSVDIFGGAGDLRGSRLRWDVRPIDQRQTELVLRASQSFDRENMIMRQLYKLEPLFEYGVNVGLDLVVMRAVKQKAQAIDAQQVRR